MVDWWSAGGKESYVFTTDRNLSKELRRHFPKRAIYFQNSIPFAWQYKVPTQLLPTLLRHAKVGMSLKLPKNRSLKNKNLAAVENPNLPQEARSTLAATDSTPATQLPTPREISDLTTRGSEEEKA